MCRSVGMRWISLREICSHPCPQISHTCYWKGAAVLHRNAFLQRYCSQQESWTAVITSLHSALASILWSASVRTEMLQLSWQLMCLQLQHLSCWRAWPGCNDGEWVWTDFQDCYISSSSYPWCRRRSFSAKTPYSLIFTWLLCRWQIFCDLSIFCQIQRHLS